MIYQFKLSIMEFIILIWYNLNNVKLNNVRLNNVKLNNVRLNNVKLNNARLNNMKLNNVRLNNVKLNNVKCYTNFHNSQKLKFLYYKTYEKIFVIFVVISENNY